MKSFLVLLVGLNVLLCVHIDALNCDGRTTASSIESRLKRDLLCDYDKNMRPREIGEAKTNFTLHLIIRDLKYNEYVQSLKLRGYLGFQYNDYRLTWNPENYENITVFNILNFQFWMPTFISSNRYNGEYENLKCSRLNCFVRSNGNLYCNCFYSKTIMCDTNYKYWPYDEHECSFKMRDRILSATFFEFFTLPNLNRNQKLFPPFDVLVDTGTFVKSNVTLDERIYSQVEYKLKIRRLPEQYIATTITPLIILLAINGIVYLLAVNSIKRYLMICHNIIQHYGAAYLLFWIIPRDGEICPLIIWFLHNSLNVTIVILAETILVEKFEKFSRPVPRILDTFSNLFLKSRVGGMLSFENPIFDYDRIQAKTHDEDPESIGDSVENEQGSIEILEKIANRKWKDIAMIIDRSFFVIILVTYLVLFFTEIP